MGRVVFLLFGLVFLAEPIFGQSAVLYLTVSDQDGQPIREATVLLKPMDAQAPLSALKTDPFGKSEMKTIKGQRYSITVRHIQFQDTAFTFVQQDERQVLSIVLKSHSTQLKEVKIIGDTPMAIKKDTLEYVARYFKSGNEDNLEDLAKKLPGLEVNHKGEIIYKGKKIEKVMVDGREFFGNNVKMATKNIPANIIEKLQVIENYSDNSVTGDAGHSGKNALNIVLDEKKKNILFGEGFLAAGFKDRYHGQFKSFYFNKKLDIGFINNYNNIGEEVFTTEDYLNFYGGIENVVKSGAADQALKLPSLLFSDKDRAYRNVNQIHSINLNYKASEKLKLNGFGILSKNKSGYRSDEQTAFLNNNYSLNEEKESSLHKTVALGQLNLQYTPGNSTYMKYTGNHNFFRSGQDFELFSEIQKNSFEVAAIAKNKTSTTTHQVSVHHALNSSLILSGQLNYELHSGDQSYFTARSGSTILGGMLDLRQDGLISIIQHQEQLGRKFDGQLSVYKILSANHHLKFQMGYSRSADELHTGIFLNDTSGHEMPITDIRYINQQEYVVSDKNAGIFYIHRTGIFAFHMGGTAHAFNINGGKNNFTYQPDLTARINWRDSRQLRMNYRMENKLAGIHEVSEGYIVEDYRTVNRGNDSLKNSLYHTISANYLDINLYSFTNLNLFAAYSRKIRNIRNRTEIDDFGQFLIPENNSPENYFIGTATFSRRLSRRFEIKLKASCMLNGFFYQLGTEFYRYSSTELDHTLSWTTYFKKDIIAAVGIQYKHEKYTTNVLSSTYTTTKPFLTMEASLPNHFTIKTDYTLNIFRQSAQHTKNVYSLLSVSLQKKIRSFTVGLSGRNLFNTKNIYRSSFRENSISSSSFMVLPRTLLLSAGYRF
ncbi:hypothetical protein ACSBL2_16260 [Pedobacter sp. AW31-3R]|uniref:hypothetical protein n=1 Tax=Pedobacter sp. AW31-3R TaxID=3445781 RepID=UPI003F9EFAD9